MGAPGPRSHPGFGAPTTSLWEKMAYQLSAPVAGHVGPGAQQSAVTTSASSFLAAGGCGVDYIPTPEGSSSQDICCSGVAFSAAVRYSREQRTNQLCAGRRPGQWCAMRSAWRTTPSFPPARLAVRHPTHRLALSQRKAHGPSSHLHLGALRTEQSSPSGEM